MLFTHSTFIGIDPTAGKRPFTYAAIDQELQLLALVQTDMEQVLAFSAGQSQAVVAVCSPRKPNQGLMRKEEVRQNLSPPPKPGRWVNYRIAEYQLRQHNIRITPTPDSEKKCNRWIRNGFTLYRRLEGLGYQPYPLVEVEHIFLEVYPHACFSVLLGQNPLPKITLEGQIQRQLLLHEVGVNIQDAMRFFEEITRHRLLKGYFPSEFLYSPQELDALIAAYTAWLAISHPDQVLLLGDEGEGQIVLPCKNLKYKY